MPKSKLRTSSSLWLSLAVLTGWPVAAEEGTIETIELIVDVHDALGRAPLDLGAADFEVLERGEPATVLDARQLDEPWRLVVYLDPALLTDASRLRLARALAMDSESLAALGSVEVVDGRGAPRVLLEATRDPARIRAALHELAATTPVGSTVSELRAAFLDLHGRPDRDDPTALRDRVRKAARLEAALLAERLGVLGSWIASRGGELSTSGVPTAWIWLADGFDVELSEFYIRASGGLLRSEIQADLAYAALDAEVEALVDHLIAAGWIAMPLSLRAPSSRGPALWIDALRPLRVAAAHTGGVVLSQPEEVSQLLANLERRWVVTYEVTSIDPPADPTAETPIAAPRPRRVSVASRRDGLIARSALWREPAGGVSAAHPPPTVRPGVP